MREVGPYSLRSAALLRAVILGDRAGLDDETELRLQEAGTYHVLAISGGNIAILAGLLVGLGRALAINRRAVDLATSLALIGYGSLVGGGASVNRAVMMAACYLLARAWDHRAPPLNILAVSAGLGAVLQPLILYDTAAWLTYGATLAILLGTPVIVDRLQPSSGFARAAIGLFAASLAAELALFPIGAFMFSRVTVAGLVVNFAAIPLMTVLQVSGMALVAAWWVAPPAVPWLAAAAHASAWALVESARLVDLAPWVTMRLAPPALGVVVTYYAGWVAWGVVRCAPWRGRTGRIAERLGVGAALACVVGAGTWIVVAPGIGGRLDGQVEVTVIDVGQGSAALVRTPGGHAWLVDAGGAGGSGFDIGRRVIEPVLWAQGVRTLSGIVVSHGDVDHADGAPAIIRDLAPPEVWEGVPVVNDPLMRAIREAADRGRALWRVVQRGDAVSDGAATLTVWHPPPADWERQRVRNDDSVVVEVRIGDVSIVLPGDVEAAAERALATVIPPAPIRVLVAPHHGSATSSTWPIIRAARPSLVVISAGRGNRYGHPHASVLARYREAGVPVWRTDQDGAIVLRTDGRVVTVRSFVGRRAVIGPISRAPGAPLP